MMSNFLEVLYLVKNCSLYFSYISKDFSSGSCISAGEFSSLFLLQSELYKLFLNKDYLLIYEYLIHIDFDNDTFYSLDIVPEVSAKRRKFYCNLSIGQTSIDDSDKTVFHYNIYNLPEVWDKLILKGYLSGADLT